MRILVPKREYYPENTYQKLGVVLCMPNILQGDSLRLAFDAYYSHSVKKGRRKPTLDEIRWFTNKFLKFANGRVFSHDLVQEYLDWLLVPDANKKAWTIKSMKAGFKMAKKFSQWLVDNKMFDEVFKHDRFTFPEEDDDEGMNLVDLPSIEVAQQIVLLATEPAEGEHINHRRQKAEMRDAFNFVLRTGIRIGELRKMKGEHLRLDAETPSYEVKATVSKSKKFALLPLSRAPDFIEMLRRRTTKKRLFYVGAGTMNAALKRGCEKYGWTGKLTNHSLRHIFACNCAKNGMPVYELCRLMRHASIEITNKYYIHYNVKELAESQVKYNDLVKREQPLRPVPMVFEDARIAFEKSGIVLDERLEYLPEISEDEMVLRVRLKHLGNPTKKKKYAVPPLAC